MVELQSGFQIKKLRSDRGGEYTSTEFRKFCEDLGLERQLTVAYSPQQNGVAERKNRTIVEMARTMLYEKRMPIKFWGAAVNVAVYILNRYPTSALTNKTPFEAFSGRKPGVKHMRIFGSLCYTYVPSQLRHKLEETSEKRVFVGYGTCEKGYKKSLWNWEANEEVHTSIPWDNSEEVRITEGREEFESPNQALESPSVRSSPNAVTTPSQEKRQASPRPNPCEIETTELYDHTPLRWKNLNEIFAQCKVSIVEPENFAEETHDEA
ncbi:unnamed protein product [Prunus armeniaca]